MLDKWLGTVRSVIVRRKFPQSQMAALVASLKFSLTRTKNPLHLPHTYIEPNTKEIIRHVKERVGFQPKKKKKANFLFAFT